MCFNIVGAFLIHNRTGSDAENMCGAIAWRIDFLVIMCQTCDNLDVFNCLFQPFVTVSKIQHVTLKVS